jgi:GntR family transcriptional repressor for pyruvate dehydrogenase complex
MNAGRAPLHRQLVEILSDKIVNGELASNSLLPPERELCATYGVSRTVVREAVKLLESHGLVRIERGRGTVVQEARPDHVAQSVRLMLRRSNGALEQLLEVRRILETGMAGLAADRRTEADLRAMQASLDTMAEKPGEPAGYVDADLEFHYRIAEATHNPVLLALIGPLGELLRESRIATFSGPEFVRMRTRQHRAIYDAIRDRDADAARALMGEHLGDTLQDLKRRKHAEAFA